MSTVKIGHGADRTGDCRVVRNRLEAGASFDFFDPDEGAERDVVHVGEMLTKRLDLDAALLLGDKEDAAWRGAVVTGTHCLGLTDASERG
ncbi:MAG: hypothetical protein K0B16_01990 [Burkholderiaceae bacterium]|nr:hypothetical protein [Burkholderiaceae bacterium]